MTRPTRLIVKKSGDEWMLVLPSGRKVCAFPDEFTAYSFRRDLYNSWKKEEN